MPPEKPASTWRPPKATKGRCGWWSRRRRGRPRRRRGRRWPRALDPRVVGPRPTVTCAPRTRHRSRSGGARRCDHGGAEGDAELHRGGPDATGRRIHEQGLRRRGVATLDHRQPGDVNGKKNAAAPTSSSVAGAPNTMSASASTCSACAPNAGRGGQHPATEPSRCARAGVHHFAHRLHPERVGQRRVDGAAVSVAAVDLVEVQRRGRGRITTWPGPGSGSGTSSMASAVAGSPYRSTRHARTAEMLSGGVDLRADGVAVGNCVVQLGVATTGRQQLLVVPWSTMRPSSTTRMSSAARWSTAGARSRARCGARAPPPAPPVPRLRGRRRRGARWPRRGSTTRGCGEQQAGDREPLPFTTESR